MSQFIETVLTPEKQIYANGDFRIYACSTKDQSIKLNNYNNVSIKGVMPRLDLGSEYKATLELGEINEKFGASYICISIFQDMPDTSQGQRDYLSTIMTEKQLAEVLKVYPHENTDIIELIKSRTFEYKKVSGFGEVVFERIYQKVVETIEYKELLGKYGKYGITFETILQLTEELGGSRQLTIQKLEDCPYILTLLSGWGFKRADVIAKRMGIKHDDINRIRYGIKYVIEDNQQNGHTYMYKKDLLRSGCDILEVSGELIEKEIENTDGLKIIEDKIALQNTYNAEYYIAEKLKEMLFDDNQELDFDVDDFVGRMEKKYDKKLTHQQRDFFEMVKKYRVGLLIGFAGTGKTQLQKFLVELLDELGLRYSILSPSAQAAKVSTGYTGVKATTIHRKVGWGKDKKQRMLIEVDEDYIIIDEAGMMDIFIQNMLLQKLKNNKVRILFVGDPFQLLSVQAGNFLHDAIESDVIPKTMLDIVFRQKEGGLLDFATKIRLGEHFVKNDFSGKQVYGKDFILHCVEQGHMENGFKYYYKSYLNKYAPKDIMVLSPTKKGKLGTIAINKYIQSEVNQEDESKKEHPYGEVCIFRTGDYVINTQNMYDVCDYDDNPIELVNGDKGILDDIVKSAEEMLEKDKRKYTEEEYRIEKSKEKNKNGIVIHFNGLGKVRTNFNDISQLLHAWCITIHKGQGDAAPATLIIADKSHKFQLSANLIYTAITRSTERGILLTQAETLNYAIKKVDNMRRQTFLQELLKEDHKNDVYIEYETEEEDKMKFKL